MNELDLERLQKQMASIRLDFHKLQSSYDRFIKDFIKTQVGGRNETESKSQK